MTDPVIESRHVSFSYEADSGEASDNGGIGKEGIFSLRDVSLRILPGECIVLCGKSGSGKTTFSRLLNGLCPGFFPGQLSGSCMLAGCEAGKAPVEEYVPLVGSVFQNPKTQYFNTNTEAELAFPCENMGIEPKEIRRRVTVCAEQFGLKELMDRSIFKLSGGEKQRIAFAAACMLQPGVLVLDEPTSNLDNRSIAFLHDMIAEVKAQGVTVIIAEHRLAWVGDLADRYFYFEEGRLAEQWSSEEFKQLSTEQLNARGLRAMELLTFERALKSRLTAQPPDGKEALSVHELWTGYQKGSPVYRIKEFKLNHGEIVGLMGQNGVGKSTLAKTLCGLLKPLKGEIFWHGRKVSAREMTKHSFLVMQDVNYQLFGDSVREEVLLGAACPECCDQVLRELGLSGLEERHPMSLSGGQKQRTAIAGAMLSGKELILLDEPTSGLDHYHMMQVGELLLQLKKQGKCVLVITHDEELAAIWCDRVIRLEA